MKKVFLPAFVAAVFLIPTAAYSAPITQFQSNAVVTITWQTTSQYSGKGAGQQDMTFPQFQFTHQFQQHYSSAVVQATVFGTIYADAGSQLGSGHNGGVTITKP